MIAVHLSGSPQKPVLERGQAPRPAPGEGELMIRVCAAGVTLTEVGWSPTWHTAAGKDRVGAVPCHEFSGVIAAAGKDIGRLEIGQEVFGMNDWYADGALAEYCIAPFSSVAPKPPGLTHAEAASIPISALTAWQGLFDHARLQAGERVLVHGGSGGVGIFVIQLAKLHGARVIATASAANLEFVASLGAEALDYRKSPFEESVHGLDVVFDTVGGETLHRSWSVLRPGGRMVTIVSDTANTADDRVRKAFFIVEPNQKQLSEIGDLLEARSLRPFVDTVVPFSQAPDLYAGRVRRRGRGKLVVAVAAEGSTKGKEDNEQQRTSSSSGT